MEEAINHLIIINGVFINIEQSPCLIELNLCSYDITKKQFSAENTYFITPSIQITPELMEEIASKTMESDMKKFIPLDTALSNLDSFISTNFVSKQITYGIVYQDELILNFLPSKEKLPSMAFNIYKIFNSFYNTNMSSLNDMLNKLNLKPTESNHLGLKDLNTMERVINKMIKDGKIFSITSDIPKPVGLPSFYKAFYLRMKNFPSYITKQDIFDLLYPFQIMERDIALAYDFFGRKTGEVTIRMYNERNYKELVTMYKFYYYNNENLIDIVDSRERDFLACQKSEIFSTQNIYLPSKTKRGFKVGKIFLKMSKILSAKEEELKNFFQNYTICENGIKINKYRKGNSTGEAVIAFINENECKDAISRENGRLLMNQIITLENSDLEKYEEYASSSAFSNWIKILSEYISSEDVQRSLFIANLPLDVTKEALLNFLQIFNINESNLVIDKKIFHENGSVLIKFPNEDDANEAKTFLQKSPFEWKGRSKKLTVENLLFVVNKGNEN